MRIGEICTRTVVTCAREASALDVARLMREHHVGCVVVVEPQCGRIVPVGVVTDRDLVVEVLACAVDPELVRAGDLVVGELETATEGELVFDAVWHLRHKGIRRLPVVNQQGELTGILSADDVSRFLAEQLGGMAALASGQARQEQARRVAS